MRMRTRPLTTTETGARLGKSRETARRWAASGRLAAEKAGDRWLIEPAAVAALAAERKGRRP